VISIDIDDDDATKIKVDVPMRYKEVMRAIPGAGFPIELGYWRVPLSWSSCISLRETFGAELTIGDRLTEWAYEYVNLLQHTGALREALVLPDGEELPAGLGDGLFEHQKVDVAFMTYLGRALLFSDQGTGKSASTVTALRA
jgi:hypothetical protein